MNTGTPVFKIDKFQYFVTICEKSFFEVSNFHKQNHFIIEAFDWKKKQKNTEMSFIPAWQWSL